MRTSGWKRFAAAAAVAGLVAACEQPTEVTEDFTLEAFITPPVAGLPGQVKVCKEGPVGDYTFDVTAFDAGVVLQNVDVNNEFTLTADADNDNDGPECLVIATTTATPVSITIEELTTPASDIKFLRTDLFIVPPGGTQSGTTATELGNPATSTFGDRGLVFVFVNQLEVTGEGCTLTQGYWKTHADDSKKQFDETWNDPDVGGPDATFLHGLSWIEVLNTSPKKGNAWFILAHQYIAAFLNVQAGADPVNPDDITQELADALALLTAWDTDDLTSDATGAAADAREDALELAGTLDNWNNGVTGPGHCENDEPGDVPLD